jgi:hypothetical protein
MADFDNGDIVRLAAVLRHNAADDIVNVWHVRIEAGGPMAFAAASQDFQEYVDGLYRPIVAYYSIVTLGDRIAAKNMTQSTVWAAFAWNPAFTGASGADRLPTQVAVLGWGRTQKSRVQIRKYFGPFTENNQIGGSWDGAITAAMSGVMSYHIGTQTMTNGLQLKGVAYNRTAGTYEYAVGATATSNPVIQRRRRRGRGA